MIGNDLVDLELASRQSNWRRKGFLEKVFSRHEQEIITTSTSPDCLVWLLWSMKEAAYKAHQREFKLSRKLNWLAQECKLLTHTSARASGTVNISGKTYCTTSEITSDYIHTSAEKPGEWSVKNAIFETSSSEAKKQLKVYISKYFSLKPEQVHLKKDAFGMPLLEAKNSLYFDHFSLSDHGRFYAYSLSLINCETSVKQS